MTPLHLNMSVPSKIVSQINKNQIKSCLNIKMLTAYYHNKNTDGLLSMHRVNNGLPCGKAQERFGRWMRN